MDLYAFILCEQSEKTCVSSNRLWYVHWHIPQTRWGKLRACMRREKAAAHDASKDAKVEPVDAQPECVVGAMREYQLEGLRWLVSRVGDSGVNAILADEMVRPLNAHLTALRVALARCKSARLGGAGNRITYVFAVPCASKQMHWVEKQSDVYQAARPDHGTYHLCRKDVDQRMKILTC